MKELTLNGKRYLSTRRAADITGYTTDYVGQLARQGKVDAELVGRNWYVEEDAIKKHKFGEVEVVVSEEEDIEEPKLEVLMDTAEDVLAADVEEPVSVESEVAKVAENPLKEMEDAWQGWYKAQKSIATEEDEAILTREDIEKESEEVSIPITKLASNVDTVSRMEEVQVEKEEEEEQKQVAEPIPSPLPMERSWSGTGLVAATILAILFTGAITVTAGYVLTRGTDTPMTNVYQGVQDYFLGIQRVE